MVLALLSSMRALTPAIYEQARVKWEREGMKELLRIPTIYSRSHGNPWSQITVSGAGPSHSFSLAMDYGRVRGPAGLPSSFLDLAALV